MRLSSLLSVCLSVCLSCLFVCNVGVLWPNGCMDHDETWHADRPRPGHIVLDGNPTTPSHFSVHVYCDQTAGWMRIPLGTEAGLDPCDSVLDGDPPLTPRKGAQQTPTFWPTVLARIPAGLHFTHKPYCPLGSAWRAAVVEIQPDNCHPSSCFHSTCSFVIIADVLQASCPSLSPYSSQQWNVCVCVCVCVRVRGACRSACWDTR